MALCADMMGTVRDITHPTLRADALSVEIRSDGKRKIKVVEVTSPSQINDQKADKADKTAEKIRRSDPRVTVTSEAFPCG